MYKDYEFRKKTLAGIPIQYILREDVNYKYLKNEVLKTARTNTNKQQCSPIFPVYRHKVFSLANLVTSIENNFAFYLGFQEVSHKCALQNTIRDGVVRPI